MDEYTSQKSNSVLLDVTCLVLNVAGHKVGMKTVWVLLLPSFSILYPTLISKKWQRQYIITIYFTQEAFFSTEEPNFSVDKFFLFSSLLPNIVNDHDHLKSMRWLWIAQVCLHFGSTPGNLKGVSASLNAQLGQWQWDQMHHKKPREAFYLKLLLEEKSLFCFKSNLALLMKYIFSFSVGW